jgi:sugar phosphate isomerase/epimerase
MTQRLFVSSTFVPDQSPLCDALDICARMPIDGVELGSNHCFEGRYPYLADFDFSYLVHNFFPIPEQGYVVNIASADDSIRQKSLAHIRSSIDFTSENNADLYTFHPGFLSDPVGADRSDINFDFKFDEQPLSTNRKLAEDHMYRSLDEIVTWAKQRNVTIAVETEGSVRHHHQLLMQSPSDFDLFKSRFSPVDLGINLNIGHVHLASRVFSFSVESIVDCLQHYLLAMELSHNEGEEDSHQPLIEGAWYWPIILREEFRDIPKILEFRDVSEADMHNSVALFRKVENEQG